MLTSPPIELAPRATEPYFFFLPLPALFAIARWPDIDWPFPDERWPNWDSTTCRATPLARDFTAGLVAVDFTQVLTFRAVFPTTDVLLRRLTMAVAISPPASAPIVVTPMTLAVRLRPFRGFERLVDVLDVLDFISLQTTSFARTRFQQTMVISQKLPTGYCPQRIWGSTALNDCGYQRLRRDSVCHHERNYSRRGRRHAPRFAPGLLFGVVLIVAAVDVGL